MIERLNMTKPKMKSGVIIKVFGELLGVLIAVVIMTVFLPRMAFVTKDYYIWLPIGIAASALSAFIKILGWLLGKPLIRRLAEIAALGVSFYSTYYLRRIFPFDFSVYGWEGMNQMIYFALGIALIGIVIGIGVNLVKLFSGREK